MPCKKNISPRFILHRLDYLQLHTVTFIHLFHAVVALLLHTRSRSRRTLTNLRPAPGFFDLQIQFFSTFHYFVLYTHIHIVQLCLRFQIIYIVCKNKTTFSLSTWSCVPSTPAPNRTTEEISSISCSEVLVAIEWKGIFPICYKKAIPSQFAILKETSLSQISRFGFYPPYHVTSSLSRFLP